jgi:lipid A disaccharide synthetase
MDCPHLGANFIETRERVKKTQMGFRIEKKLVLVLPGNRDQEGRKLLELLH